MPSPLALVLGNERIGVDTHVLGEADAVVAEFDAKLHKQGYFGRARPPGQAAGHDDARAKVLLVGDVPPDVLLARGTFQTKHQPRRPIIAEC